MFSFIRFFLRFLRRFFIYSDAKIRIYRKNSKCFVSWTLHSKLWLLNHFYRQNFFLWLKNTKIRRYYENKTIHHWNKKKSNKNVKIRFRTKKLRPMFSVNSTIFCYSETWTMLHWLKKMNIVIIPTHAYDTRTWMSYVM